MVAYILAVNPQILGVTGGTCDPEELCEPEAYRVRGKDCLFDPRNVEANECLSTLRLSLTTATAASSLIACFIMGFFANLPLALAPGMGINIYVAYQVVGQDLLTYQQAMVAIFLEGWIFIFISMTGIRGGIIRLMPKNIAFASSVGIGLLLAFSGLRNLGVIVFDSNTLVTLGGCSTENHRYTLTTNYPLDISTLNQTLNFTSDIVTESDAAVYSCAGGEMRSATMWLGFAGGLLMAGLTAAHVRGSLFLGIAFVTIISWIPGLATSYLGEGSDIPGGEVRLDLFKQVVAAPSLEGIGLAWDWSGLSKGHFWVVLFTFLYIDLLDCTGTLLSMATLLDDHMEHDAEEDGKLELYQPFLKESKEFEGQQWAFLSDGLGIVAGSMMGITPLTVYIESAAGIEDGGRTGVTAIVVAFFFFIALFFSPILASIPPYATGPALILVGILLIAHVDRIAWDDTLESIPAFLTVIVMPFTLSVAYGVIAGIVSYLALHMPIWLWKWMKGKIAEFKKRRRKMLRRKARTETEGNGSAAGGSAGGGGIHGGGNDEDDSEEESANGAASVSSTRSRRRVHRKVFGLEDSLKSNFAGRSPEHGGGSGHGDFGNQDVPDPRVWGMGMGPSGNGNGRQGQIGGGGAALRRSTSHGSFHPAAVAAAMGGGATTAGMMIGTSGPRGMPRSMSHAAYGGSNGGSGYSSRNGSYGQEGILASSLAAGGGNQFSPMRGPSAGANNFSGRSLSRAISLGTNVGGGGQRMPRSRTMTDVGNSVPNYGVGTFLGGGGVTGSSVSPIYSPTGYRVQSANALDTAAAAGGGDGGSGNSSFQLFPTDTSITLEGEEEYTTTSNDGVYHNLQTMPDGTSREENSSQAPLASNGTAAGACGDTGHGFVPGAPDDSFLLFGGKLLSLDLEGDAADAILAEENGEKGTEPRADGHTGAAGGTTTRPLPMVSAENSSIENQDSLVLSSPDTVDLGAFPSVDLNAFKAGLASSPFNGRKEAVGSGSSGGEQRDREERYTGDSEYLASLPAEHVVTIHESVAGKGKGSISFAHTMNDGVAEPTAAAAAADTRDIEAGVGHSTLRVEGWPSSSETSPQHDPQLLADSLATENSFQTQSSQGSGRALKRVESAAAIRLRGLFETGNEASNSSSDAGGGGGGGSQRGTFFASSPPSTEQPGASAAAGGGGSEPRLVGSSSPAPIRAPHQSFGGAPAPIPATPFDQMATVPENMINKNSSGDDGGVVSPHHHILSPRAAAAAANINLPSTIMSGQVWSSEEINHKQEDSVAARKK
jgi:AGZA family xanthine/uracil permease-like MFS transporter